MPSSACKKKTNVSLEPGQGSLEALIAGTDEGLYMETNCFFNDTAPTDIYPLSLHDALPISRRAAVRIGQQNSWRKFLGAPLNRRAVPGGRTLPPPLKRVEKPILLKLFLLDAQGGYAGEYAVDEECVIEYGDFLAGVPEAGLADQQSMYLGEYRATAFQGDRMSLVAISRGAPGPEELAWVTATLIAAEAQLGEHPRRPAEGPDKAVLESLSSALDKRDVGLADREKTLAQSEERSRHAAEEARKALEAEGHSLRNPLQAAPPQPE